MHRRIIATTPKILGLEVHIPAGVTLRAPDGQPLESLSLTPIPLHRTPFPSSPGRSPFGTHRARVRDIRLNVSEIPPAVRGWRRCLRPRAGRDEPAAPEGRGPSGGVSEAAPA
jgi:hypothetical protein